MKLSIHKQSDERQAAWDILRRSASVRMLAALAAPYWPQSTARHLAPALAAAAASRPSAVKRREAVERREALLDDALDDSFPASDPPSIVAPVYGGWRDKP